MFLATGSTSGVGLELAKMLYGLNGTVYVAARSADKINATIKTIESRVSTKTGRVEALQLDLVNLASIGQSAREFLAKENRLDVLVHNAGLMTPPAGSKTDLVSIPNTTMRSFTATCSTRMSGPLLTVLW